jgi:hypothetical protein
MAEEDSLTRRDLITIQIGTEGRCLTQHISLKNVLNSVKFEVFTAMTMKNEVYWDVTPCDPCNSRRFGGT